MFELHVQIIDIVTLCLTGIAVFVALMAVRKASRQQQLNAEKIALLREDISALYSGAVGIGKRLTNIERRLRLVNHRQDKFELRDIDQASYDHAVRMVKKGADIMELVDSCGISKGEAELIKLLNCEQPTQH